MYNLSELKKLTVPELKKIAKKQNISLPVKCKKDQVIKLIMESDNITKTVEQKKSEISISSSSTINIQYYPENKNKIDENNLPDNYNKDKLVFMIRDPRWGFVYWEITGSLKEKHNLNSIEKFIRCYDITGTDKVESSLSFFDIKINDNTNNWYINFPSSNRTYIVDYGYFKDGKFITVLRSNPATFPRSEISDQIDQEWMMNDDQYQYLLKASGAGQLFQQIGSQELLKFIAGNVNESLSSGNNSSISSPFGDNFNK
jgi:hypothetical protein